MVRVKKFPGEIHRGKIGYIRNSYGKLQNNAATGVVLTDEQEDWIRRWYPKTENKVLSEVSGLSCYYLHKFAKALGVKKSKSGMKAINLRRLKSAMETCKLRGVYEKRRGVRPDAAIEGCRRRWERYRLQGGESPMEKFRRLRPNDYAEFTKMMSERRKKVLKQERRRILFGMKQETNLNVVTCRFKRSQLSHRFNALDRGYLLMEDCSEKGGERYNIYYDGDTARSKLFERNLVRDGFTVLPLEN